MSNPLSGKAVHNLSVKGKSHLDLDVPALRGGKPIVESDQLVCEAGHGRLCCEGRAYQRRWS